MEFTATYIISQALTILMYIFLASTYYLKNRKTVLIFNIFIAEDFTLNLKFTYCEAVVKSSKIITGNLSKIPSISFVYPSMNVLPAVRTGVL